jgi:Fic family protein
MKEALEEALNPGNWETIQPLDRLDRARVAFGGREFSRAEYLKVIGRVSLATASRDLAEGVKRGFLVMKGDKRTARYQWK